MQVLQAAAILGDGATFPVLQATSGRSEEETLNALDALYAGAVLAAANSPVENIAGGKTARATVQA